MGNANTQSGKTIEISDAAQNSELDLAGFQALDPNWTKLKGVGSIGETGTNTNIVTYDTLEEAVQSKGKGISNAGDPQIECRRISGDAGQQAFRAAGDPSVTDAYAFRITHQDGTIEYQRGLVTGPVRPGGRNEDFELEQYTLALVQAEVVDNP